MGLLIAGLVLFLGVHSVSIINAPWRERMVARVGLLPWQALYAIIAVAGLIMIIRGYSAARLDGVVLYTAPGWLNYVSIVLMVVVFPLLFAAYLPGRIQSAARHPMLAATKIWALAHLLVNGNLADVVLFGALLAWAIADRISMKRRTPLPVPGAPPTRFNDALAVILGLAAYAAFLLGLHQWLFGVSPLP
ncbi:MAG: NnrU family protein [Gammaproteobacteria bacterium]|jgi:uncharacterized membrane protein